jgi:hypothetical protein
MRTRFFFPQLIGVCALALITNAQAQTGPAPAIGQQRTPALGQRGSAAIGQQNTTAIGQQGSGTAIMPPGTNAGVPPFVFTNDINASGNVTPGAGNQTPHGVNSDGSVTALPGAGSTAITPGGTNGGTGVSQPSQPNIVQTNTFGNP